MALRVLLDDQLNPMYSHDPALPSDMESSNATGSEDWYIRSLRQRFCLHNFRDTAGHQAWSRWHRKNKDAGAQMDASLDRS